MDHEEELDKKPELVKTMSVFPPKGSGEIRLISIKSKKVRLICNLAVELMSVEH